MNRKLGVHELGRLSDAEFRQADKIPVVVILENVRSASNVGSVFRTADSFAIGKIYLCGYTAIPPHREILKTALGATESVEWEHYPTTDALLQKLKRENYMIASVEQTTGSIDLVSYLPNKEKGLALIFGNEVDGIAEETIANSDLTLEIKQYGTKHSLNVSVCAGIVLFHISNHFHS